MRSNRIATILLLSACLLGIPLLAGCGHYAGVSTYVPTGVAIVDVAPPPMRVESYGNPPRSDYSWISGHWGWLDGKYQWVDGYWTPRPSPSARWVPGRWNRDGSRYYWMEGRWQR
jgi:hypothetical protein